MAIVKIKGVDVLLDDEDVERVLAKTWQLMKGGRYFRHHYKDQAAQKNKSFSLHRFIYGDVPDGFILDHKDGDTLNNKKNNLRVCTSLENAWNVKKSTRNTSGYKGVTPFRKLNKWRAVIRVRGALISLGLYWTKEEAYAAYCKASKEYHGEYGRIA